MFLKKLDYLMSQKGINRSVLARESGIPYTTIDGLYKKGYDNIKLSTLNKLCDYFGVTLDYLVSDDDDGELLTVMLTPHQQQVITAYINHPELHLAIDKLLGVEPERTITPEMIEQLRINPNEGSIKIAAYGGGVREEKVSADKIQEAKRMAMEILERKKKEKEGE